jgi:hypothetical protein
MNFDRLANLLGAIVTVALVAVVVGSPRTADVIRSFGNAFANAIHTAQGKQAG